MDTTASTSSMQSIQKNVEAVLEEALLESGSKELFRWRRQLQKKLSMNSGQFIALLVFFFFHKFWFIFCPLAYLCPSVFRDIFRPNDFVKMPFDVQKDEIWLSSFFRSKFHQANPVTLAACRPTPCEIWMHSFGEVSFDKP